MPIAEKRWALGAALALTGVSAWAADAAARWTWTTTFNQARRAR